MSLQTSEHPTADKEDRAAEAAPRQAKNERGIWAIGGKIGGAALSVLTYALLTRVLTQEEFGKYLLIFSTATFLMGVALFGLDRTLVRYIAEGFAVGDRARVKKALSLGAATLFTSLTVCFLVVPPALYVIGHYIPAFPSDAVSIAVILLSVAFSVLLQSTAEVFRGMHDQKHAAMFDAQSSRPVANGLTLLAIAAGAYIATLYATNLNAASAMGLQVLVLGGLCLLGVFTLRKALSRVDTLQPMQGRELPPLTTSLFLLTCVPLVLSQTIGVANIQGELWILGATVSEQQLAIFGAARRFVMSITMPMLAFNLVVVPSIPKLYVQGRIADLEKLLQRNALMATIPSVIGVLLVMLFPGPLLAFMYGTDYAEGAACLVIFCIGQAASIVCANSGQVLMLTGRERVALAVEVLAAIALFTLGPFVAQHYGITGFAVVSSSILVTKKLTLWLLAKRLVGVWTHASPLSLIADWREAKTRAARRRAEKDGESFAEADPSPLPSPTYGVERN